MSKLIDHIRASVIGAGQPITTPFGQKPLIYADYTASGRALTFIEDYYSAGRTALVRQYPHRNILHRSPDHGASGAGPAGDTQGG